jgi:crotonobetainyl-CoA:carnitine CoA-transferase CaiB-like acyl-CoA transferase
MTMRYWRTEKGGGPVGPNSMVNGRLVPWLPTIFESKDGVWFFTMGTRRFRKEYSEWLGLPMDLQAIPVNVSDEEQYRVYNHMARRFKEYSWADLDKKFADLDCIVLPVQHASAAFDDPQIQHNGYIVEVTDPEYGRVRQGGVPYTMRKTPPQVRGGRPRPGEHTEAVLLAAGLPKAEVDALRKAKAV